MKWYITYQRREGACGGANSFLRAFAEWCEENDMLVTTPENADVILMNSHHELDSFLKLRRAFPDKIFVHRLGPIFSLHRGACFKVWDRLIIDIACRFSDGIIFQSNWSENTAKGFGWKKQIPSTVITNAASPEIFLPRPSRVSSKPLRIIATGWSPNANKGFDWLAYLDEALDPAQFHISYFGHCPTVFKNIKVHPPIDPSELAKELRAHDVYFSPVTNDACSMGLVEGLTVGLPVIARASGGNPELVPANNGVLFSSKEELLSAFSVIANDYQKYAQNVRHKSINDVGNCYVDFASSLLTNKRIKNSFLFSAFIYHVMVWFWRFYLRVCQKICRF